MGLPPVDARVRLSTGVVVVVLALLTIAAFLPIATCPNCDGRGGVPREVNERWIRAHPLMISQGIRFSSLGRETCVRCSSRGRVTPIGAWLQ